MSFQFNDRQVTGSYFICQTCSALSNTLHAYCAIDNISLRTYILSMIAPITTLSIEPFVYLVSVLLDLGMSVVAIT